MTYNRYAPGTPEEKVRRYIETHDNKPLVFSKSFYIWGERQEYIEPAAVELPDGITSLRDVIEFVLKESIHRKSLYLKSRSTQCTSYARRSSFDIWRHVKYFCPTVDLFSVMRIMAGLPIFHAYCSTVRKRVFLNRVEESPTWDNYIIDEYGLEFHQWFHIGEQYENSYSSRNIENSHI